MRIEVNEKVFTKVAVGNAADVDLAVKAAREAYKTSWGLKVSGYDRGRLLSKLADVIEQNIDELSAIEALDCGMSFFLDTVPGGARVCVCVYVRSSALVLKANIFCTPRCSICLG